MAEVFVGIDVSKNTLEIAIWPGTEAWQLANAEHELKGLIAHLQVLAPALVVLEASG
jgi:transposase